MFLVSIDDWHIGTCYPDISGLHSVNYLKFVPKVTFDVVSLHVRAFIQQLSGGIHRVYWRRVKSHDNTIVYERQKQLPLF